MELRQIHLALYLYRIKGFDKSSLERFVGVKKCKVALLEILTIWVFSI